MSRSKNSNLYPILFAFMCMGFGDAVGPLADLVKDGGYTTSSFQAQLVTFMGFIMFGVLSIPLGLYQDKKGKKIVLIFGLLSALLGMLVPTVFGIESYYVILFAVLFLGAGNAILQVAGNPIMRDVSAEGKYSRNLSMGQFVKAIGTLSAVLIPIYAIKIPYVAQHFETKEWWALFPIYTIGILVTIGLIAPLKIKENHDQPKSGDPTTFASCMKLLTNRYVLSMVLGIFFYVGAEVCLTSNLGSYFSKIYHVDLREQGLWGTLFFIIALLIGRFTASVVLNWLSPKVFLLISTSLALLGFIGLYVGTQTTGMISVFIIGLGFANVFPLIFSIAIDKMPNRANELSGLMVTAILGGAFVPLLMGVIKDSLVETKGDEIAILTSFIIPILCFVYIFFISIRNLKESK